MKKWIMLTVAVATLAVAVVVFAQPGPPNQRSPRGERPFPAEGLVENQELIAELGLDEEQVQALKQVHLEAQKAMVELRARNELAEIDLKAQLESGSPEIEKVMETIEQTGQAQTEMKKHQVRVMLETREILGPEAWKQLNELRRERMRERVEQRRGGRNEWGDGPPRDRMRDSDRPWPGPRPDRPPQDSPRGDGPPPREGER